LFLCDSFRALLYLKISIDGHIVLSGSSFEAPPIQMARGYPVGAHMHILFAFQVDGVTTLPTEPVVGHMVTTDNVFFTALRDGYDIVRRLQSLGFRFAINCLRCQQDAHNCQPRAALAHECAHITRRDYAKNLFYEYVAAVVAYHPAAWLMRRRIAETRELVCDEMAAGAVGGRPEYAASLLRLATAMARAAARPVYVTRTQAIGVFDADILEERIMRLTMDLPAVSRTRKIAMATVATCALMLGAGTAMALSFDVTPQDGAAAAAPLHEKVYKVGGDVTPPVLTYSVDAEFPDAEKNAKQGLQGVAVVELIVDSKGGPRDIRMKRSLRPDFDKRAINAVRQYKFDPAMRKGKPVAVAIAIEVNFRRY
jgi:TonB family protein